MSNIKKFTSRNWFIQGWREYLLELIWCCASCLQYILILVSNISITTKNYPIMTEIALLEKTEGKCNMTSDFSVTAWHCLFFLDIYLFYRWYVSKISVSSFNCFKWSKLPVAKSSHVHSLQKCNNQLLSHVFTSLGM